MRGGRGVILRENNVTESRCSKGKVRGSRGSEGRESKERERKLVEKK